jgi:hypothetical protein
MLRTLIDRMQQTVSVTPHIIRAIARADEGSLELLMSKNDGYTSFLFVLGEKSTHHFAIISIVLKYLHHHIIGSLGHPSYH